MKGFILCTLLLVLGVASFAKGSSTPASLQEFEAARKPTLAWYVQFDDQNPRENCAGQGGGEGQKLGDKCMYRPHLYDRYTNKVIGYATFLVSYVAGYEDYNNVEEFVLFTFYLSPPGKGDNEGNNTVEEDNLITLQGRFKSTGRATRSAVTGGTGKFLGAVGYAVAEPAGTIGHVSKFYHSIWLYRTLREESSELI